MNRRCAAITKAGQPCRAIPAAGKEYCAGHDPVLQDARRKDGEMYAKRAPNLELEGIKRLLYRLAEAVESGEVDTRKGAVLVQIYNALRGAIEDQRRIRELEDVVARLEALEEQNNPPQRWAR